MRAYLVQDDGLGDCRDEHDLHTNEVQVVSESSQPKWRGRNAYDDDSETFYRAGILRERLGCLVLTAYHEIRPPLLMYKCRIERDLQSW